MPPKEEEKCKETEIKNYPEYISQNKIYRDQFFLLTCVVFIFTHVLLLQQSDITFKLVKTYKCNFCNNCSPICAYLYKTDRYVYFTIIFRMLAVCSAVVQKLIMEKLSLQNKCGVDLNSNNNIN